MKVQQAIQLLLYDEKTKHQAAEFSRIMEKWDGPKMAAQLLYDLLGKETSFMVDSSKLARPL